MANPNMITLARKITADELDDIESLPLVHGPKITLLDKIVAAIRAGKTTVVADGPEVKWIGNVCTKVNRAAMRRVATYDSATHPAKPAKETKVEQPAEKPAEKQARSAAMTAQENAVVRLLAKERGVSSTANKAGYSAIRREVRALRTA